MMKWDPTDLLICLKVEPHRDRDGVEHSYVVAKDGLRPLISVFQFDGDVYFSMFRDAPDAKSLIDLQINQCPAIELVAATPVGLHVVVEVEVVAVARRKVRFKVICRDEAGLIGEGFHERAIIDREPFMARVATKLLPAKTQ